MIVLLLAALVSGSVAYYEPPLLEALAAPAPDHETSTYLLPRLTAKFRPHGEWETAPDPRFYVLTELERDNNQASRRVKRTGNGPSLSIVNPLDVLRQRLLLEIARRRMRQTQSQIQANRDILESIGKRSVSDEVMVSSSNSRSPESSEWSNPRWSPDFISPHHS